ncbi:MAG: ATP synthase F1 subunit delta [Lactobacillus sp.]|nr:ATP synthase F1 subunit delta [Lactobacillus sp.]
MALTEVEIASRYGHALFDYLTDSQCLEDALSELKEVKKALIENPKFIELLDNPFVKEDEKLTMLTAVTEKVRPEVKNIFSLLLEYGRMANVVAIIEELEKLSNQALGQAQGVVKSAVPLTDAQIAAVSKELAQKLDLKTVKLKNQVDQSLIGGLVAQVNDVVIDGSIKHKLAKLRRQLSDKK